jgi:tRNA 2-thiouridine synthesizing protein A
MEKNMKADKMLDCIGLLDPMPIVRTAQKMKELRISEVLVVIATDKGIKQDMPAWCRMTGNEYLGMEETKIEIKIYVRKNHD